MGSKTAGTRGAAMPTMRGNVPNLMESGLGAGLNQNAPVEAPMGGVPQQGFPNDMGGNVDALLQGLRDRRDAGPLQAQPMMGNVAQQGGGIGQLLQGLQQRRNTMGSTHGHQYILDRALSRRR